MATPTAQEVADALKSSALTVASSGGVKSYTLPNGSSFQLSEAGDLMEQSQAAQVLADQETGKRRSISLARLTPR